MEKQSSLSIYFGIIFLMIAFAIIAGGLIFLFLRYQKRLLTKQQELHRLDTQYKKDLIANSIQSAEEERMRIAKDIHDEIGSVFSTLSLSISRIQAENTTHDEQINNSKNLIQSGIDSVRRISHGIVPFELEILGLHETLENYFHSISSISAIKIDFICTYNLRSLNETTSLAIYRILQELFSNCIKYAHAKTVMISIDGNDEKNILSISYKDDGIGFDLKNKHLKKGIGLKNIESRIISIDGSVSFFSEQNRGFNCNLTIPINDLK